MSLSTFEDTEFVTLQPRPRMVAVELATVEKIPTRAGRRRRKLRRFLVSEISALAVFLACVIAGTSQTFATEELTGVFKVLVCLAAVPLLVIPIVFYGLPRRGYRVRRYI